MAELLETIQRLKKDLITSSSSIPPLSPVEQHALRRKIVRLQLQLHNKKEVGREKRRRERERTTSLYLCCAYVGNQQITQRIYVSIFLLCTGGGREWGGVRGGEWTQVCPAAATEEGSARRLLSGL